MFSTCRTDLFRLMSKANKYSGAMTQRKQRKADEYAYMAGAMLHQNGVNDPRYQPYLHAYSQGGQYGMSNNLLNDFRSGSRKQSRVTRRTGHGHYANRPASHVPGKGRKAAAGSMFDYNDTDTSSSSSEDEGQARRY